MEAGSRRAARLLVVRGVCAVRAPVAFGTRVVLRFKVSPQSELIEVGGTVRWNDGAGFGVQFDGLHARDVYALNKLFEKPGD